MGFDTMSGIPGLEKIGSEEVDNEVVQAVRDYWSRRSSLQGGYEPQKEDISALKSAIFGNIENLFHLANKLGGGVALNHKEYVDFNISIFRALYQGSHSAHMSGYQHQIMRRCAENDWHVDLSHDPGRYSNGGWTPERLKSERTRKL